MGLMIIKFVCLFRYFAAKEALRKFKIRKKIQVVRMKRDKNRKKEIIPKGVRKTKKNLGNSVFNLG